MSAGRRRRLRRGGFVFVIVLVILLGLAVVVGALYTQANAYRSASNFVTMQRLSASHAQLGFQQAINDIQSGAIDVNGIVGTCAGGPTYTSCAPGSYIESSGADGGTVVMAPGAGGGPPSPLEGAGALYNYVVYRSTAPNTPSSLYTIEVTGYAGVSVESSNTVSAVVSGEIDVSAAGFRCVNAYDCTGS